jgi:hypothetical protein
MQRSRQARPLGVILVAKGFLTDTQLVELLQEQTRQALDTDSGAPRDRNLGQILIERGMIRVEQLNECLRLQAEAIERGEKQPPRLGELLVRRGYAGVGTVIAALAAQQKMILVCPRCSQRYNATEFDPGKTFRCPVCGGVMAQARSLGDIQVVDSVTGMPAVGESPAEASGGGEERPAAVEGSGAQPWHYLVAVVLLMGSVGFLAYSVWRHFFGP